MSETHDGGTPLAYSSPEGVTRLLERIREGDRAARAALFDVLYSELYRRACRYSGGRGPGQSLHPTALVHDVFVRLAGPDGPSRANFNDRSHFLAVASKAMRDLLVDHARRRNRRESMGKGDDVSLDALVASFEESAYDLEALGLALDELGDLDPEMAEAVDLYFFAGLSVTETAEHLRIPLRTLQRRLAGTRAWLRTKIE